MRRCVNNINVNIINITVTCHMWTMMLTKAGSTAPIKLAHNLANTSRIAAQPIYIIHIHLCTNSEWSVIWQLWSCLSLFFYASIGSSVINLNPFHSNNEAHTAHTGLHHTPHSPSNTSTLSSAFGLPGSVRKGHTTSRNVITSFSLMVSLEKASQFAYWFMAFWMSWGLTWPGCSSRNCKIEWKEKEWPYLKIETNKQTKSN